MLAVAGYRLEEGRDGDDAVTQFSKDDLELMADAEHRGWEETKRIDGWSYWRSRNSAALRHPLPKPYDSLSKADKDIDRDAIREYPKHARSIGYRIVRDRRAERPDSISRPHARHGRAVEGETNRRLRRRFPRPRLHRGARATGFPSCSSRIPLW